MSRRAAFLSDRAARERMPVALLSGFLGSGKTTLVNALLRDPRMAGTAVAVNEFGAIPIDQALIDHGADRSIVLANGCLCCNLSGDLESAVMRLFSRRQEGALPEFARLVIEPSGLADPAPIAQAILRNPVLSRSLRLDAIVTTVDAGHAPRQLDRHPETRKQVALADTLVLTKLDMADHAERHGLETRLRQLNPLATIVEALHGAIDPAELFPPWFFDAGAPSGAAPRSPHLAEVVETGHAERFAALSLSAGRLRWDGVEAWLRGIRIAHADRLLRIKGLLDIEGAAGPIAIHGIHHVLHAPVELDEWPSGERGSQLVIIADGSIAETIRGSWQQALPGMLAAHGI